MRRLCDAARLLPKLTADNAVSERTRLAEELRRGRLPAPQWRWPRVRGVAGAWRALEEARRLADRSPAAEPYLRRLEELELDLALIGALGAPRQVRALAARRFGTGAMRVPAGAEQVPLSRVAEAILGTVADTPEPRHLPADAGPGQPSLGGLVRALARAAGLEVQVRVEPRLAAAAAAGERTVLIAERRFGAREARRLAVHEVLGHLVSAANARAQPIRLLELGMAGSYADQEGLAIWVEERAGVLDGRRLRTLAARVVAADRMYEGSPFGETARELVREHGFEVQDAVAIAERAYRGGGVARDVSYLAGWLRVRHAIEHGRASLDELRAGRVSVEGVPCLRRLREQGLLRAAVYRPSLSRSLVATHSGTSLETSPPSEVTSLTRFEAT